MKFYISKRARDEFEKLFRDALQTFYDVTDALEYYPATTSFAEIMNEIDEVRSTISDVGYEAAQLDYNYNYSFLENIHGEIMERETSREMSDENVIDAIEHVHSHALLFLRTIKEILLDRSMVTNPGFKSRLPGYSIITMEKNRSRSHLTKKEINARVSSLARSLHGLADRLEESVAGALEKGEIDKENYDILRR